MGNHHVFLMSATLVIILSLLPSLFAPVEAKFSFSDLSSEAFSSQGLHAFRRLAEITPFGHHPQPDGHHPASEGHHHIILSNDPCKPTKGRGHHPGGLGHHAQAGGHPCAKVAPFGHHPKGVGHHPTRVGHHSGAVGHHPAGVGHHPAGVGKHPAGVGRHGLGKGHHPAGVGHHNFCDNNATACFFPPTPVGATTCCGRTCTNVLTNPRHCGSCGNLCAGDGCCNGVCINFQTDPAHCGSCTNVCAAGDICSFGMCGYV